MNKILSNKTIFATIVILLVTIVVLCFVATVAWFDNSVGSLDFPTDFGGSSIAAYFAGGEGSSTEPYLIENATNLYNLAWLQYLGYFNMRSGLNNGRAQTYFKLSDNIPDGILDMKDVPALPPIGTSEYPFIGHFDGNDKSVTNLTVSNRQSDFNGVYPSNANFQDGLLATCTQTNEDKTSVMVEFVAMFGVVGDFDEWVANSSEYAEGNNNGIEIKDPRDEPKNMSEITGKIDEKYMYYGAMYVGDMYVDNLVVKSYTDNTLVGLAAGYVAGTLKNFGVYRSTINLGGGRTGTTIAKTIDDNGNSVAYGSTVSKFSIVGDYDATLVGWSEKPSGSSGDGDKWGGSVEMLTLNRRLNYMFTVGSITSDKSTSTHKGYNTSLYNYTKSGSTYYEFYWKKPDLQSQLMYMQDGTVLPLNIDKDVMDIAEKDSDEITIDSKYGYHTNSKYNSRSSEAIKITNTGYIVGAGTANNSYIRANTREQSRISDSYSNGVLSLSTIRLGETTSTIIKDEKNGGAETDSNYYSKFSFEKYKNVRDGFLETLSNTTYIHGFHFSNALPATLTSNDTTPEEGIIIDKKYYSSGSIPEDYIGCKTGGTSYEFVKGGLNFTVHSSGVITTILGTFYSGMKQTIFDLFYVERTNGKIDTYKKIDKIYKDSLGNIYYDDAAPSSAELVFSFSALTGTTVGTTYNYLNPNKAYYFEIPVNAGDYVIGSAATSSNQNAYLMYLDIGANGSDDDNPNPSPTEKYYNIDSVDFVNSTTVIVSDGKYQSYADIVAAISDLKEATNGIVIVFKRDGSTTSYSESKVTDKLLYYYDGTLVTVKFVVDDDTSVEQKTSADVVLNP